VQDWYKSIAGKTKNDMCDDYTNCHKQTWHRTAFASLAKLYSLTYRVLRKKRKRQWQYIRKSAFSSSLLYITAATGHCVKCYMARVHLYLSIAGKVVAVTNKGILFMAHRQQCSSITTSIQRLTKDNTKSHTWTSNVCPITKIKTAETF